MDESESLVRVTIFGQEYTVKGKAQSSYIQSVANYVNLKMHEIERNLHNPQSDLRVAILAAMNITDELFTLRKDSEKLQGDVDERANALIEIIEENL